MGTTDRMYLKENLLLQSKLICSLSEISVAQNWAALKVQIFSRLYLPSSGNSDN